MPLTPTPTCCRPMTKLEHFEYRVRIRYAKRFDQDLPNTPEIKRGIREFFSAGISANDTVSACRTEVQLTDRRYTETKVF